MSEQTNEKLTAKELLATIRRTNKANKLRKKLNDKAAKGTTYAREEIITKEEMNSHCYICWNSMIRRSFAKSYKKDYPTYKEVTCCEEWLSYLNFKKWFNENYYEIEGHKMHLDKDILYKGNKIYSPETCVFVPHNINTLFLKSDANRGNYPIGVSLNENNTYLARCKNGKNRLIRLGSFSTPVEAFLAYKKYKENLIKEIADTYKDHIPEKLYGAMYKYEVEITD